MQHTQALRITRTDGSRIVVYDPHIAADSVVGSNGGRHAGVALSDIRETELLRSDPLKTTGLVLLFVLAASTQWRW